MFLLNSRIPLVRFSSESMFHCSRPEELPLLPQEILLSPAPRTTLRRFREQLGLHSRVLLPHPQSQSFSRSYRSIMPTSLIYILLSTRGCSPWRPDAVMGTACYEIITLPRIFNDRHVCNWQPVEWTALPGVQPDLWIIQFRGHDQLKRKENSSSDTCRCLRARFCVAALSVWQVVGC